MPLYKEQGIVLRTHKLGEADRIVTILTQDSGKIRGVAKGVRRTKSRFGARLEPFTHVSVMCYRGQGALDTVTQAEIISPHRRIRDDLALFAAGEIMLEAADKVAEEHERNSQLFLLVLYGLRALDEGPDDPAAVAEAYLLKLLSISGFSPSLRACASCGAPDPLLFSYAQGGAVCAKCADAGAVPVTAEVLARLDSLSSTKLASISARGASRRTRDQTRLLLTGFTEFYLERRMRSIPLLARSQE